MVYAAREGWYREESNMNTLLPHDILRISTILESWGDVEIAQTWIDSQKARLRNLIQEELDFKLFEIEEYYREDLERLRDKLKNAREAIAKREEAKQKPTKSELGAVQTNENALNKMSNERDGKINAANAQADKERRAIDDVEIELLEMLQDGELRQRYFSVVEMEELAENEFNLNIPRYVDTFEPEEEIDLNEAIAEFNDFVGKEKEADNFLTEFSKSMVG